MILKMPEPEQKPGLSDLGLQPDDITMAFIYWDFIRELPAESLRQTALPRHGPAAPGEQGLRARVVLPGLWFPLRVHWLRPDEDKPWRKLEFKGFKKHADGVWFMKTAQLSGDNWKTLVDFADAELHRPSEKPCRRTCSRRAVGLCAFLSSYLLPGVALPWPIRRPIPGIAPGVVSRNPNGATPEDGLRLRRCPARAVLRAGGFLLALACTPLEPV